MMHHTTSAIPVAVIVDYGMGNLFSVHAACTRAGLHVTVTADPVVIRRANILLLPGVGAFGDAMNVLHRHGLDDEIRTAAAAGTPIVGICLGMQLLATESEEFGCHAGLGIIPGRVIHLGAPRAANGIPLKVPHVGWNEIARPAHQSGDPWAGTLLDGLPDGAEFSFVHSFRVVPSDPAAVLAETQYGDVIFASVVRSGNVYGFQFHPERSGAVGAQVYAHIAAVMSEAYAFHH